MPYPLTPVRWFHSGMADAPVLRGEAGALIELLDACLINGFCTRTLTSLVVSGGVATATISAGNPYEQHAVIRISGASIAALNGDHRIDTAGASSFTFPAPGVADGAASGTMTVIRSPAGWSKPFSGTNKAAYQGDENSTQLYLRVDDTEALYSNVRGYENLTDIDTGTGLFPTAAQQENCWWTKSRTENNTARHWALVADGAMIWFMPAWHSSYPTMGVLHHFGDGVPFSPGDAYFCTVAGYSGAKGVTTGPSGYSHPSAYNQSSYRIVARNSSGTGAAAPLLLNALSPQANNNFLPTSSSYPSSDVGGGAMIGPPIIALDGSQTTSPVRGIFPGPRPVLASNPWPLSSGVVAAVQAPPGGGLFLPVSVTTASSNSPLAPFDILGPWR